MVSTWYNVFAHILSTDYGIYWSFSNKCRSHLVLGTYWSYISHAAYFSYIILSDSFYPFFPKTRATSSSFSCFGYTFYHSLDLVTSFISIPLFSRPSLILVTSFTSTLFLLSLSKYELSSLFFLLVVTFFIPIPSFTSLSKMWEWYSVLMMLAAWRIYAVAATVC